MDDQNTIGRRMVRVAVNGHLLRSLFLEGFELHRKCIKGLPPTAKWVGEYFDMATFRMYFVFQDESFEEVPYFEVLPVLDVVYQQIDCQADDV